MNSVRPCKQTMIETKNHECLNMFSLIVFFKVPLFSKLTENLDVDNVHDYTLTLRK